MDARFNFSSDRAITALTAHSNGTRLVLLAAVNCSVLTIDALSGAMLLAWQVPDCAGVDSDELTGIGGLAVGANDVLYVTRPDRDQLLVFDMAAAAVNHRHARLFTEAPVAAAARRERKQ